MGMLEEVIAMKLEDLKPDAIKEAHHDFLYKNLRDPALLIHQLYEFAELMNDMYVNGPLDEPFGTHWFGVIIDAIDYIKKHSDTVPTKQPTKEA